MNRANAPGEDAAGGGGGGASMLEEGGWRPERRQGRGGEGGQTEWPGLQGHLPQLCPERLPGLGQD